MIARMVVRDVKSWGKSYIQVRLGGVGEKLGGEKLQRTGKQFPLQEIKVGIMYKM